MSKRRRDVVLRYNDVIITSCATCRRICAHLKSQRVKDSSLCRQDISGDSIDWLE